MGDEEVTKKKVTNLSKLLKQTNHPNKFYVKIFGKLDGYMMTIGILKDTGIGKLINSYKTHESPEIVEASKQLVRKWKKQVSNTSDTDVKQSSPKKIVNERPLQVYFYRPNVNKKSRLSTHTDNVAKACNVYGIYSGAKQPNRVFSLKDLAMRVLLQNVDSIYHVGSLTCEALKPALLKCSDEQLNLIEHRNPQIKGTLESVWKKLVESEFRSNALVGDSWKAMYWDKVIERKEKLKRLTNSIATAKHEKEKSDSIVKHLVGPLQPMAKSRGVKRPLNYHGSVTNGKSSKAPLKRCLDSHKSSKYRR